MTEVSDSWAVLETHGFPPEAVGWPARNIAGLLPEAIEAAISTLIRQREDLLAEVLQLRSPIQPQQMRERIAELQYEAGMYQSLYESLWVCSGCGTRKSMEQIRGETPQAISCCPEREMAPAHTRPECGDI